MSETKLKENEILIGSTTYTIKPIKMKYIKTSFYSNHMAIKKIGFIKLLATYRDGEDVIKEYLKAVFDLEEIADDIIDNLDAEIVSTIRQMVNKINEIEDEDEKND